MWRNSGQVGRGLRGFLASAMAVAMVGTVLAVPQVPVAPAGAAPAAPAAPAGGTTAAAPAQAAGVVDCLEELRFVVTTGPDGIRDDSEVSIRFGDQRVIFTDANGDDVADPDGGSPVHKGGTRDEGHATFVWHARLDPCVPTTELFDGFQIEHYNLPPPFGTDASDDWHLQAFRVEDPTRPGSNGPFPYFTSQDQANPLHYFQGADFDGDVDTWSTGTDTFDRDVDGDGLSDREELRPSLTTLLPLRFDTFLPRSGSDPCRKTIAVEVDWLKDSDTGATVKPSDAALGQARDMFAQAPVESSDVVCRYYRRTPATGIQLLTDTMSEVAEIALPTAEYQQPLSTVVSGDGRKVFDRLRDGIIPSLGGGALTPGRSGRFFYNLWGHAWNGAGAGGMCCTGPRGTQFANTPGSWATVTDRTQAAAFVHELGHALGLKHGGNQSEPNYKPNYLSVMNYRYSGFGIPDISKWRDGVPLGTELDPEDPALRAAMVNSARLDYSREALPTLRRNPATIGVVRPASWELDEGAGLAASSDDAAMWFDPNYHLRAGDAAAAWIDWDDNGSPTPSVVNVNVMGGKEVCITPGPDGLDTSPVGDDAPVGQEIYAGIDGKCTTPKAGNDSDVVSVSTDVLSTTTRSSLNLDYPHERNYETGVTGFDDWDHIATHLADIVGHGGGTGDPSENAEHVEMTFEEHERHVTELLTALLAAPPSTTIDATALSSRSMTISGVAGPVDTRSPRILRLAPGQHTLSTPGSSGVTFAVDAAGTVDYDPALTFLAGRGTSTLTVLGSPFTVDATALSSVSMAVGPATGWLSSRAVQEVRLLPGRYSLGTPGGTGVPVTLTAAGTLGVDPALSYVSGNGTSTLTVEGLAFSVDATGLSSVSMAVGPATGWLSSRAVQEVRLLPGRYSLGTPGGTGVPVTLTAAGALSVDPALTFVSGNGTSTLTVHGLAFSVDATALSSVSMAVGPATGWLSSRAVQDVRLLPGRYSLGTPGGAGVPVTLTAAGTLGVDPALSYVSGNGTSKLTVHGLAVTVDATRLPCPHHALSPATGWLPARPAPQALHLLPATFTFVTCAAGPRFTFSLTPAGTFDHAADLTAVTGRGTSTLTVG